MFLDELIWLVFYVTAFAAILLLVSGVGFMGLVLWDFISQPRKRK